MSEELDTQKNKVNWSPEKVMSISALFVSLISVIALFYQLSLAREENELIRKQQSASVLPHLSLLPTLNSQRSYSMAFINQGVGPAFIKEVEFTVHDATFQRSDLFFNHIRDKIYEADSILISVSTFSFMEGDVIPANEEINIFTVTGQAGVDLFYNYLDSVEWKFSIIYEDVYEARWRLGSENRFPVSISKE